MIATKMGLRVLEKYDKISPKLTCNVKKSARRPAGRKVPGGPKTAVRTLHALYRSVHPAKDTESEHPYLNTIMNAQTTPIHGTEVEGAKKVKLKQYQAQLFFEEKVKLEP